MRHQRSSTDDERFQVRTLLLGGYSQQAAVAGGIYRAKPEERQEIAIRSKPPISVDRAVFIIRKGDE